MSPSASRSDGSRVRLTLNHSMLFRARRMVDGYVSDTEISSYQICALTIYMQQLCSVKKKKYELIES